MARAEEGKSIVQLKINDKTKGLLIELAGGERKVGEYLDKLVPDLHAAQKRIARAERGARQRELAITLLESQGDSEEDLQDAIIAKEISDAIDRGEIATVSWEEVKAGLRAKGLLDE